MKIKISLLLLFVSMYLSANWEPFSPEGIRANRITFYVDYNNNWAVAASDGTHLYHLNTGTWHFHPSILPVTDASWLDGEYTMIIMDGGGVLMEEGIYYLDPVNGTYYPLDYLETPHFIKYDDELGRFYVGHRHGIRYTDNITDWYDLEFFNDMDIVDMEIYGHRYVVSRIDNIYGIYYSDDAGAIWTSSSGSPMISDLEFKYTGKLYGVFPDNSWSSGLWSSNDYGASWNVEFWAMGINCVGLDAMGDVYVGFGEEAHPNEGIAKWDSTNQNLSFENDNLPNLNIHQITYNQAMSIPNLFCCTDSGAYIYHLWIGIDDQKKLNTEALSWPNPASDILHIKHELEGNIQYNIYSVDGKLVDSFQGHGSAENFQYPCSDLREGIYIIKIDNGREVKSLKWIKK